MKAMPQPELPEGIAISSAEILKQDSLVTDGRTHFVHQRTSTLLVVPRTQRETVTWLCDTDY
jgi:hypothetical protein